MFIRREIIYLVKARTFYIPCKARKKTHVDVEIKITKEMEKQNINRNYKIRKNKLMKINIKCNKTFLR